MQLRGCSHLHFIQAIRAGSVEKILNVNSRGRPALSFKNLEDIYESEDDKIRDSLSTLKPEDSDADMVFDSDKVKTETKKGESNTEMFNCYADDDEEGTDGIYSEKMTLKQLKEQCKTKKRKPLRSLYLSPEQDYPDRHPEEDECDLEEPISSWKLKNPIGKRKRAKKCSSSPQTEISVKSNQISRAEDSMQNSPDLPVLTVKAEVPETEYTERRDTSCSSDTSNFCAEQDSCTVKPDLALGEKISLTAEESQSCIVNELCFDHLEHIEPNYLLNPTGGETMDAENLRKTCQWSLVFPTPKDKEGHILLPLLEESSPETNFLVNDQGSDTSNHFQSNSSVHEISTQTNHACGVQWPDMAMDSNLCCLKPDSAGDSRNLEDDISEILPPNLEMDSLRSSFCNQSTSWNTHCSSPEIVLLLTDADLLATAKLPLISISGEAARDCLSPHERPVDFEIDSSAWEEKQPLRSAPDDSESNSSAPNLEMDFISNSFCNHSTSWDAHYSSPEIVLLSTDDDLLASKTPPLLSVCGDVARDCLSPHKSPVDEVDSTAGEGKQRLRSSPDDSESNASEKDLHCDGPCKSPLPVIENNYPLEQCHPPERLLSTRKAISPTSQEKLRQAMEGVELDGQIDHYKCKDKLQFTKDTQDSPSPVGPDTLAEVDANPEGLGEVTRTSDAISPRQMTKKPRSDRKGSPPRVFQRAPHLSRPLPHASTGAASIHSCSERAIAFSQRQMQDIESLATMLMEELKFMKDIVEEQVQSEAPPTTSLKYGVDEVKTAIKNATKAEEKTRKWLAMMTRDSNRFCKLMMLNEKKGEIASGNTIRKDRKKITFADEAGGVLCHVKFIETSTDSPDSKN